MSTIYKTVIAGLLGAAVTPLAWAQEQTLDTVVVTATRVEQSIKDVKPSITVIDSQQLNVVNADHVSEALALVPGVALHRGSGAEHLTSIRSPILTGGAGAGSFLFLQNGVALRSAGFANVNGLFGAHYEIADQIEVIRGPSGAAYGANAIHGVVNVITPDPRTSPGFGARLSADSQNRFKFSGQSATKTEDHSFLIAGSSTTEAGYRQNAGMDQQKLTLRHVYDGDVYAFDTILSGYNLNQETAGFIFGEDALNDRDLRRQNEFPFAYRDAKAINLQSSISFDITPNLKAKITPYARWNDMEFLQHFLPSQSVEKNGHWSVGGQTTFSYEKDALSVVSGVDVEFSRGELSEVQSLPRIFSYTQGTHYDYDVDAFHLSAFTQADYAISNKTSLLAALRLDSTSYKYQNNTDSGIVGRFLRLEDQDDSFLTASPKLGLTHQMSENFTGYISYSRGSRAPQTSDLYRLQINQADNSAEAETIDSIELGLRGRFSENIDFEVVAFSMDKSNFFFRDADGFNVSNGKTRHRGLEVDADIKLSDEFSISSAVSYAEHTYRFNRTTGNSFETILKGNEIDTAPKFIGDIRGRWQALEDLSFEIEWSSLGEYFTDAANAHSYAGHDVFNFRSQLQLSEYAKLGFSIRNLTGELYAERADFAFGRDRYMPGEGRTFGVSLSIAG